MATSSVAAVPASSVSAKAAPLTAVASAEPPIVKESMRCSPYPPPCTTTLQRHDRRQPLRGRKRSKGVLEAQTHLATHQGGAASCTNVRAWRVAEVDQRERRAVRAKLLNQRRAVLRDARPAQIAVEVAEAGVEGEAVAAGGEAAEHELGERLRDRRVDVVCSQAAVLTTGSQAREGQQQVRAA